MRIIYSTYMASSSDDDTIRVADKSERPQPSAPAAPVASAPDSNNLASQISDSIRELVRSDSDVSDFSLTSPLRHDTTIGSPSMHEGISSIRPRQDNVDPRARDQSDAVANDGSDVSSQLSILSRTPTPPAELKSSPSSQPPTSARSTRAGIKQESASLSPPMPTRLSQPPPTPTGHPISQPSKPGRPLRRTDHALECTHTGICTCRIHAAHPSILTTSVKGEAAGAYPHFSEWALGGMEWPESAMRSSIERETDWRTGKAWR